jgi:hypothetical protein
MDRYLRAVQETIASATTGLSTEQFKWHPYGKWSVAEIVEHLWLTYRATTIAFNLCLKTGKIAITKPTLQMRTYAFMVLKLEYLPWGRPAPAGTIPQGTPPDMVMARIQGDILAMDESIYRCEAQFGNRRDLVDNPVLGPLTATEWRRFHWLHTHHHARQIERLKRVLFSARESVDEPLPA